MNSIAFNPTHIIVAHCPINDWEIGKQVMEITPRQLFELAAERVDIQVEDYIALGQVLGFKFFISEQFEVKACLPSEVLSFIG